MLGNNKIFSLKRRSLKLFVILIAFICPLLVNFYFVEEAEAAMADIEILTNIETSNDSGTSPENRWQTNVEREINFVIRGSGGGHISAGLTGPKTAVLVIPPELVGSFTPTGQALIETNLTLNLRNIPLLSTLFSTLDALLGTLVDILNGALGSLVGVNLNLDTVYQQVDLLNSLQDLPNLSVSEPIIFSEDQQIISVNLDNGLGRVLAENLSGILRNLSNAVSALKAEGSGLASNIIAELINGLLSPVKTALVGAINGLFPLLEAGGSLVSALADASLLGNTTVTISGTIEPLIEKTKDFDAHFYGTVVKSAVLDVDLLRSSSSISSIYFQGERFEIAQNLLPQHFDFGTHPIQTAVDQTFVIQENLSEVLITDTRSREKDWQVKISQTSPWENATAQQLANSVLTLYGGPLKSTFPNGMTKNFTETGLALRPFEEETLFSLSGTSDSGTLSLPIERVELFVPKNTPRTATLYETTLIWTLSETPNS